MPTRRSFRIVLPVIATFVFFWVLLDFFPGQSQVLPAGLVLPDPDSIRHSTTDDHGRPANNSRAYCASHGYKPFEGSQGAGRRKVYDLFMMNTELDFLELRLNTLYNHVDYFVIVESPVTFQGRPKNLTIRNSWDQFKQYHDKMIYHQLEFAESFAPKLTWDYEDLQRDSMFTQVFPKLTGGMAPTKGDAIIVADVDEIPRPETIQLLRQCTFPRRLTLSSRFYYYSFQFLHTGPEWPHPQATFFEGLDETITPTHLRHGLGGSFLHRELFEKGSLKNASWHCSSCFGTIDQFLNKLSSFSHIWMNGEKFRDRDRIAQAVREGKDLWDRKAEKFTRIEENDDLPGPLRRDKKGKFAYMVSRNGDSAGFTDYP